MRHRTILRYLALGRLGERPSEAHAVRMPLVPSEDCRPRDINAWYVTVLVLLICACRDQREYVACFYVVQTVQVIEQQLEMYWLPARAFRIGVIHIDLLDVQRRRNGRENIVQFLLNYVWR